MDKNSDNDMEQIAIIGMAGRFPGANNVNQLWKNLRKGINCLSRFSDDSLLKKGVKKEDLDIPNYVKAGYVIENIEYFDAEFFGYNAKDAEFMDPQQRIFLEIAWEALENAGCNPDTYAGSIGVFGGTSTSDYAKRIPAAQSGVTTGLDSFQTMLANDVDFLATRVSYKLNLKGPSLSLQTACSTSLVAVHLACQNLLTYQCDIALAGGVSIRLPQDVGYTYHEGMIWSPDGNCRAFDAKAHGTVLGRGAGIVVLKRLSEAIEEKDFIYAIIKGSAINNDGAIKVSYTAPSVDGQAQVIKMAHALSNTSPETIDYIEAHGTGTKLGDPIEIEALTTAFRAGTNKTGFCGIGSLKTNIGHLDIAAGIASLIKTALALQHKEIPPSLNYESPNPNIDFSDSPFYVVNRLQAWESNDRPRRAGVSSFGVGGTNAHVILEEAPPQAPDVQSDAAQLLLLSAKTPAALQSSAEALLNYFRANPGCSLSNAAYTLQTGRKQFRYRRAAVCRDVSQAIKILSSHDAEAIARPVADTNSKKIAFMFSGQGSQYINMCRGLYNEEQFFRSQVDHCAEILKKQLGLDLREVLFPSVSEEQARQLINQTWITQPALFVIEYCLVRLLMQWGLRPDAMVGHSIGEYVAACLAGVFSLEDSLALVAIRGRMIQDIEPGAMLSVPLAEEEISPILPRELAIAAINAPKMTVVSGKIDLVEAFKEKLSTEKNIASIIIHTSHAFHSDMMEPIVNEFAKQVSSFERKKPEVPFVSNVSGTWITEQQATSPEYWAQHLRRTVRFSDCMTTLYKGGYRNFVEVGPGQALTMFARRHQKGNETLILRTTRKPMDKEDDRSLLLNNLGELWVAGIDINWDSFQGDRARHKTPLPTYPFQRKRYWIEEDDSAMISAKGDVSLKPIASVDHIPPQRPSSHIQIARNDLELQISNIFSDLLGIQHVDVRDNFFEVGGDSLLAAQLLAHLKKVSGANLSLADIFEHPSVEGLAEQIKHGGGRLRSTVIELNKASSDQLIYFVVGIQIYQALAQYLDDTACCYGTFLPVEETLFSTGVKLNEWTVGHLAAAYRDEIQRHSQGRPLSIVGISFGGVVGYELARQLTEAGVKIPLLVMLDSLLPSGMSRNYIKWVSAQAASIIRSGAGPFFKKVKSRLSARQQKRSRKTFRMAAINEALPDQRLVVYADAVERFEAMNADAIYGGRTLLIQAQDAPRYPGYNIAQHFGWAKHLTGEFYVDSAPGDHLGILKPPHVEITANIIKRVLQSGGK